MVKLVPLHNYNIDNADYNAVTQVSS